MSAEAERDLDRDPDADRDREANSEATGKRPLLLCGECGRPVYEFYTNVGDGEYSRQLNCACDSDAIDGYRFRSIDQALDSRDEYRPDHEGSEHEGDL